MRVDVKVKYKIALLALGGAMALGGCSDNGSVKENPVVSVNGETLTAVERRHYVDAMARVHSIVNPRMTAEEQGKLRENLRNAYADLFIEDTLVSQYAKAENVKVSKELLKRFKLKALRGFRSQGIKSYGTLLKKIGAEHKPYFERLIKREALEEAVKDHLATLTPTNLPPDFKEKMLKVLKEYSAVIAKTNELVHARANMVWKQLKSGANFEEMAVKYTEIESEREDKGEWGTMDFNQFQTDVKVAEWAQKLKVGEFTPPIEGDNGLIIMRLDAKDPAKGEYTFSRIFFQLAMEAEQQSGDEIVTDVRDIHKNNLFAEKLASLRKAAKIEYFEKQPDAAKAGLPENGTNAAVNVVQTNETKGCK